MVYMLTRSALPSQYRSLKLFPDYSYDEETELGPIPKSRLSTRCVYAILVSIFIVSVALAATISIFEIRKIMNPKENKVETEINYTEGGVSRLRTDSSAEFPDLSINVPSQEERTPCVSTCYPYSAPKFRSRCRSGYCVCEGQGYQPQTCLPTSNLCVIHKSKTGSARAYTRNTQTPVYSCKTGSQSHNETHVISIYGNLRSNTTVVSISGQKSAPLTLVLASHFPVHWKLIYKDLEIRRVIVISDLGQNISIVSSNNPSGNSATLPEVEYMNMLVGYGDDRHNTNTTDMLRTLTGTFGSISSFSGAEFADYFRIQLKE